MINHILLLLVLGISLKSIVSDESCDKYGALLYEDIACKPVNTEGRNCPSHYNCDFSRPKSGCTFKGRNYGSTEDIPSDVTYSACSIGCRCEDPNFIRCAVLDCPENLGPSAEPGCYNGYELGKCCATGQICNATFDSKKCEVDGKKYEIGQRFYPKNTCFTCVCHDKFNGEYDKETCMKQNCAAQLHYTEEIEKKCAPAYFNFNSEEALCCPNDFICPEDSDSIKVVNREADQNSELKCQYGKRTLKLGEGFNRKVDKYGKERNLQCECVLPPLVTCKEI